MTHLPPLIEDLGLILSVAAVTTLIFKKIKQPVVLGYIIAGLIVGPHIGFIPSVVDEKSIATWSEIGVIFLLFSLGLEFSFKKLAKVGGTATITTLVTVVFMLLAGYTTGRFLGMGQMDSIFLGGILSISSTTIIFRAFEELGVKTRTFASVVLGVLVVEDLVAILLLVLLSTVAVSQSFSGTALLMEMGKLGFFLVLWFVGGIFLIPTLLRRLRKLMNDETLLVLSVALCLTMVFLAVQAGFSAPLGAFVMGSLLAETIMAERIEHLVRPVKDLFAAIFFVSVGMMIDPSVLVEHWRIIGILTLVTLIGQPLSSMGGALLAGQPLKHAVQAGMSLSQIGEFSFIIATLGLSLGVTSEILYPVAVAVSAITTFTTPYMIKAGEPLHTLLARVLPERWVEAIGRYSDQAGQVRVIDDWKELLRAYLLNIALYGVITAAVILLSTRLLMPAFTGSGITWLDGDTTTGRIVHGLLTLLLVLPFLWAMSVRRIRRTAYRHLWVNRRHLRGPLVALELLRLGAAVAVLAVVVYLFFPTGWAFLAVLLAAFLAFVVFRRRLQHFHRRMEEHFLLNLNQREHREQRKLPALAPWDMHLAEVSVPVGSSVAGWTLAELALREKHGVNIAMIMRDGATIPVPDRNERLLPGDELLVIGTDDQLTSLNSALRMPAHERTRSDLHPDKVSLLKFEVNSYSPLVGDTVRNSGIREEGGALVVGIERDGKRLLNPDGNTVLIKGDVLWVAGDRQRIKEFMSDGWGVAV